MVLTEIFICISGILITEGGQHLGNNGLPAVGSDAHIQMAGLRLAILNSLAGVGINGSCPAGILHQDLSLGVSFSLFLLL